MKDIIDRIYEDHKELKKFLEDNKEISLSVSTDEIYRKTLLLAISSYFEDRITNCVLEYVQEQTHEKHIISELVRNKFISRQYHTWFRWEEKNINSFLRIFGESFKKYLELGLDRNRLVHQNFAAFSLEKTSDELYSSYKEAIKIIDRLPKLFREFNHI